MQTNIKDILLVLLIGSIVTGCELPRIHRIDIQQGNVVTQSMVDKLKPNMTREQVVFIMGNPVLKNAFNKDRWDYVYSIELDRADSEKKLVTMYFENNVLVRYEGDLKPPEDE